MEDMMSLMSIDVGGRLKLHINKLNQSSIELIYNRLDTKSIECIHELIKTERTWIKSCPFKEIYYCSASISLML